MNLIQVEIDRLLTDPTLQRSKGSKVFEEHLLASIDKVGLAEPLKVAPVPKNRYLVIDGVLRLNAIRKLQTRKPNLTSVPAYVFDYDKRFEVRFQTDIYQDLLPSQLATLVEHLHKDSNVTKSEIAQYIGVSPATLRNYTGLSRLVERGGLFRYIVDLMDLGVLPSSNPYAWLRLTHTGIRTAIESSFSEGTPAEHWIREQIGRCRTGRSAPLSIKSVELATSALPPSCYREAEGIRTQKRQLGLKRVKQNAGRPTGAKVEASREDTISHLESIAVSSVNIVIRSAANALRDYLL